MNRPSQRAYDQLRQISLQRHYTRHAEGSVLASFGDTRVLCNATVEEKVPPFLRGKGRGWITAEYGMLPRATNSRTAREATRGKQSGRTLEIQRLIGRSLRQAVDLKALGERCIRFDCDVLQADGGTRTASITGGFVALADAICGLRKSGALKTNPLRHQIAAISVGLYAGEPVLDLDYAEDSNAQTDMNIVMNDAPGFVEIQGTGEEAAFSHDELLAMTALASKGIEQLFALQREVLGADLLLDRP